VTLARPADPTSGDRDQARGAPGPIAPGRGTSPPAAPRVRRWSATAITAAGLVAALVAAITAAAMIGTAEIAAGDVWRVIGSHVLPGGEVEAGTHDAIVWGIRLPRALLAATVGATLAVVGTVLQAVVRNPLADPAVLGGSSGAALGAVSVLLVGWAPFGAWSLIGAAFLGSLTGYFLALALASRAGALSPVRLVLAGVAVSYLLGSLANLLVATADNANQVRSVVFWQLGSLAGAQWRTLGVPVAVLAGGLLLALLNARTLNALLAGDETAASLGLRPDAARRRLVVLAALLTAAAVALSGTIAFVGLVVPHAVRFLVGSDHARLLPLAALTGAVFLVVADIAARTVMEPQELPIGVLTALVGAPLFCVLCRRRLRDA
jgi:iron complex transport system permease protein